MWVGLLRRDVGVIAYYTGVLIVGIGLAMAIPLVTALAAGEWDPATDYLLGMGVTCAAGILMTIASPRGGSLKRAHALIVTALAWLVASAFSAIPLALSGHYVSYLDALLEGMSGLTTTGLTLVQDLDHMAVSHNMWRHLLHLIGGQGIVVTALSVAIGLRGGGAISLYVAEGREEKILPNVMHTARFIWFVSAAYILLGTIGLTVTHLVGGLEPARAALHGFWGTLACYDTGGFNPQSISTLYYRSPVFEMLTVILMLAGSLNFNLHADIWRGDRRELLQNIEARALALNLAIVSVAVGIGFGAMRVFTSPDALVRKGLFMVFSAHTSTGHQTVYSAQLFEDFGGLAIAAIMLGMAFGGMASSTAGGIKAIRLAVIFRGIVMRVRESLAPPSAVITQRYHHLVDRELTADVFANSLMLFTLYIVTIVTGALAGVLFGYPAPQALFESLSATTNIGLSSGISSPTMPAMLKVVYFVQMWAGRLEFIALLTLVATVLIGIRRGRVTS